MDQNLNWFNAEGWVEAEKLVRKIGPLPPILVAAIKASEAAPGILHDGDPEKQGRFTADAISFTVKVIPAIKAAFYFAAEELDRDNLSYADPLTYWSLLSLFEAEEMTAIVALSYSYNLLRNQVAPDHWGKISKLIAEHLAIATLLGPHIENVNAGRALLIGGARFLGLAILAANDAAGFTQMLRKLEKSKALYDLSEEEARWGCNHCQVASALLKASGFGPSTRIAWGPFNDSIYFAPLRLAAQDMGPEIHGLRLLIASTEQLLISRTLPDTFRFEFDADGNATAQLRSLAAEIVAGGGMKWLEKRKDELPEDVRAALNIKLKERSKEADGEDELFT